MKIRPEWIPLAALLGALVTGLATPHPATAQEARSADAGTDPGADAGADAGAGADAEADADDVPEAASDAERILRIRRVIKLD
ncbi:MAG: hypothetical protein O7F08_02660, partial [Deltaproteobacteria bacterium]|nr:hypothetical protein [Deltaproteobacteria bacterium]